MPVIERDGNFYWGKQGPFSSRQKAEQVARAAYASGYQKKGAIAKFLVLQKGKYSKADVNYAVATDSQLQRGEKCGTCQFFDSANQACLIVGGFIHDNMWCIKWQPMDQIHKEFSGTVFTSSDPAVYTPTYGKYKTDKTISAKERFKRFAKKLGLTVSE